MIQKIRNYLSKETTKTQKREHFVVVVTIEQRIKIEIKKEQQKKKMKKKIRKTNQWKIINRERGK